ncbi:hypothetical protein [Nesterenkonia ebinurensis]|uniref:hypothetical protein n=1 Tax=Nesterenkonia ebinurensis TaxID=2608252 RepID=UPI00123CD916|nr:hypothetical protein [Nesterenkonia ebinurensis]
MRVQDLDAAAAWMGAYASWEAKWAGFLKQRIYAKKGIERPSWAKPNQQWWLPTSGYAESRASTGS